MQRSRGGGQELREKWCGTTALVACNFLRRTRRDDASAFIAGTRTNMLTKVLDAERFPVVVLHAESVPGKGDKLNLSITLHGVTRTVVVPTKVESSAGRVVASGAFTLKQTDFGIKPMSVMGGAVSVQDPMELRFRIVATSGR